jgi:hypothetical protein
MAPATQLLGVLATGLPVLRRAFSFAFCRKRNPSIEDVAMMRTALFGRSVDDNPQQAKTSWQTVSK